MMTDPLADMLTRIRNANLQRKDVVEVALSKMNLAISRILKEEGFIKYYKPVRNKSQGVIRVFLKYGTGQERVITQLRRLSKPGMRQYVGKHEILRVQGGLGITILSTSQGVMTGKKARTLGVGGEILCSVW